MVYTNIFQHCKGYLPGMTWPPNFANVIRVRAINPCPAESVNCFNCIFRHFCNFQLKMTKNISITEK